MIVHSDFNLRPFNTLALSVSAKYFAKITTLDDIFELRQRKEMLSLPWMVLGGGSNVIFQDNFPGLVLLNQIKHRQVVNEDEESWLIEVGAGESWHEFVQWTMQQQYFGLENLALIPGTVGAALIQNIGAYGAEISTFFDSLQALEWATGKSVCLDQQLCAFGYRDSFFKQAGKNRFIITSVKFRLPKKWFPNIDYADLRAYFEKENTINIQPQDVFDAVVAVRQDKLPNLSVLPNVGSFFKNPVVERAHFEQLKKQYAQLVAYPQPDGRMKLAAGWLIERCGWKGCVWKTAAVHDRQALVLINKTGQSSADILALAQRIQQSVFEHFKVILEIEPQIY